jgi:hypothetical protein
MRPMTMIAQSTTPAPTLGDSRSSPTTGYVPGICNIGPAEIARRRRSGHVALVATAGLFIVLVGIDVQPIVRLVVAVPAAVAAACYLEVRYRFCAGLGSLGLFNFGELGHHDAVVDPADGARDRAMARRIGLGAALIGLAVGILAALLPL